MPLPLFPSLFASLAGSLLAGGLFGSTKALKARACSHSVEHVSKSQRHEVPKQSVCRLRRQQVQESRFAAIRICGLEFRVSLIGLKRTLLTNIFQRL